jgi:hypothetical protein
MVRLRTIFILLVVLSVAMLPVAGAIAIPSDELVVSDEVVVSAHDCCDHEGMPADNTMRDCHAAAGCATKCFSVCGVIFSNPMIHPPVTGAEPSFPTKTFHSQEGNPPFRPPRV